MDRINSNIVWHDNHVTQHDRYALVNQKPMVLWFTGLSACGKSTIATLVERELLIKRKHLTYLLDGDNLRHGINSNLGFSKKDRDENIRRIAEVSCLLASSGAICLVSAISPFAQNRDIARQKVSAVCDFVEIYVKADIETCVARDPKGLYKKAINGEVEEFTGISSPYEPPTNPEILLDTDKLSIEEAVDIVVDYVAQREIDYTHMLKMLIPTATRAGKAIMKIYNEDSNVVDYKADNSPLTLADKASNAIICSDLRKYFYRYSILTEEETDDKTRLEDDFCFIVDPLDGTKEFIKKNGEFTVNIALSYKKEPILGIIYVPAQKKMYYSAKDHGSYCFYVEDEENINFELFNPSDKIHVSDKTHGLTVMDSRSHGDDRLESLLAPHKEKIADKISAGSSLKGCLVAEGRADIYYRFGYTMEWDTAAMHAICIESGAVVNQMDDSPLLYNRQNSLNEKGFYIINRKENRF